MLQLLADHGVRASANGGFTRKYDPFFCVTWPFRDESFEREWKALTCSALLIRAAESGVLPVARFDAMLAAQPGATGVTVAASGHVLPVDRPLELADALEGFLHEEVFEDIELGREREFLDIP